MEARRGCDGHTPEFLMLRRQTPGWIMQQFGAPCTIKDGSAHGKKNFFVDPVSGVFVGRDAAMPHAKALVIEGGQIVLVSSRDITVYNDRVAMRHRRGYEQLLHREMLPGRPGRDLADAEDGRRRRRCRATDASGRAG